MNRTRRRSWLLAAAFGLVVVVTVLVAGPAPGDDKGPQGTLALRRYLTAMGMQVSDGATPPAAPGAVFLLLTDLRTQDQADGLLNWVRDGGTLVIADPASATLEAAGVTSSGRVGHYSFGPAKLQASCLTPETAAVPTLQVDAGDDALDTQDPGTIGCFPVSGPAGPSFEVVRPMGQGRVVGLGGKSPLTNALLGKGDNPAFAFGLLGNTAGQVVFGSAVDPGDAPPAGLWRSLPPVGKVVLIQVVLALVVFALVRARRLGPPMPERIPSPVPASELVEAVGRLYRSARASEFAGQTMRSATLRTLQTRLGIVPGDTEALASTLAGLSGTSLDEVRRLLGGPAPASDEALIALGRDLEHLRQRVEGSWLRTTAGSETTTVEKGRRSG